MSKHRLQLDLGPLTKAVLDRLAAKHHLSKADTVRYALDLLDKATDPEQGVYVIDKDGVKRKLEVI